MNSKFSKVKKVLTLIAVTAVLLGLTVFGFHFSCRLKAEGNGNDRNPYARVTIVETVRNFQA